MRSSAETLLSLLEWARIMQLNPWEVAQVGTGFPVVNSAQCQHVFFQYGWQQDFLSREEIGNSIAKAEQTIADFISYWPAPKYFVGEELQFPRPAQRYMFGAGTTMRWQNKTVQARWLKIQRAGLFARTDINPAAVTYSDQDGDGVIDRFTASVPTSVTDPAEIGVYYTAADRNNEPIDETWRIRPVNVTITGGVATIAGHASLCIKPDLELMIGAQVLDVTITTNFITQLEVYRVYTDTTATVADPAQGQAEWEPLINDCAVPPCAVEVWPICVGARNVESGQISADYWLDGTNCPTQPREPDRITVNYLAGVARQPNGMMDQTMANCVAHLATSILPVDKCGCERSARIIHWWRSFPQDGMQDRPIDPQEIEENPFGPTMGGIYVWRQLRYLQKIIAVSM